jgi:hypothetical protein
MRKSELAIMAGAAVVLATICIGNTSAEAQGATREAPRASASQQIETSAQSRRRRAPTQLRVIQERVYLPPTAVRACDAWYEQEFRPSGTVIVPRMRCRWVTG